VFGAALNFFQIILSVIRGSSGFYGTLKSARAGVQGFVQE
jgi:hypothetical protein